MAISEEELVTLDNDLVGYKILGHVFSTVPEVTDTGYIHHKKASVLWECSECGSAVANRDHHTKLHMSKEQD